MLTREYKSKKFREFLNSLFFFFELKFNLAKIDAIKVVNY